MEMKSIKIKPDCYIAVILFESSSDAKDYEPLFEESFMLIKADAEEEAREKSLRLVRQPHSYKNQLRSAEIPDFCTA